MSHHKAGFPQPESTYVFHVSYGETDAMRVAYYGEYFHWFERARSQFIRERGMSYAEVEARGIMLPVRNASCRYLRPARYDEPVAVRCGVEKWGRASITFCYEVHGPPDASCLLARGETEHACVSLDGKPVRVPDWLKAMFEV